MIAADRPLQRPAAAKLLHVDARGRIRHVPRAELAELLRRDDLVIANDAATLPASLHGTHERTGEPVEIRLAGRESLAAQDVVEFRALVLGRGDFRTRTEDRPLPPSLRTGDRLILGPLVARIARLLYASRLVVLRFEASPAEIWSGLARHGRPIQYAYLAEPLDIWDTWTPVAGAPVAYEPPSAGFALSWHTLARLKERGIGFATITHAAGISSTGDVELDRSLPFDEPYDIPPSTVRAIEEARERGGRVVAVGTTVVRALEHAAHACGCVVPGPGVATQRIGRGSGRGSGQRIEWSSPLRVVDAILSGTHEPETSHYELLRAFTPDRVLRRADRELNAQGYRTHEFGDSVLIEKHTSPIAAARTQCHPSSPLPTCPRPMLPASAH